MHRVTLARTWLAAVVCCASYASAHVPIFSNGSAVGPESAYDVNEPTVSRVVYHEMTESAGQVWVTFEGQAGTRVPFRLGVPLIDRLADYRPALAVLGPGLGAIALPLAVPDGMGGVKIEADPGTELEVFHEEFTGTESWIVGDLDLMLPETGRYYVVAYVPSGEPGKLWAALGDREVFSADDIASLPETINRVRSFHEVQLATVPCFVPLVGVFGLIGFLAWFHRGRRRIGPPGGIGERDSAVG